VVGAVVVGGWGVLPAGDKTAPEPQPQAAPAPAKQPAQEPKEPAAVPAPVIGGNFVVFPVTTELQRSQLGGDPRTKAYVLIDGTSVVQSNGMIDGTALDFAKLRAALKGYGGKGRVHFSVDYGNTMFRDGVNRADVTNILRWALE